MKRFIYKFKIYKIIKYFFSKIRNSHIYIYKKKNCLIRFDSKYINGKNNRIKIGDNCVLEDIILHINGNNNLIEIDDNCVIGEKSSFWIDGDEHYIKIGKNTTFTTLVHLNTQEDKTSIIIGEDCMLSNNIIIRTSDSHPIYDNLHNRINISKSVEIQNHVWIAPNSKVFKGVVIGEGSIIGSDTLVTKSIPNNVLAVGHPAKIVKNEIIWTRENVVNH